jgi:D-tyrosyl-tRNA(Tyr) deacylase
MKMVVQRVNEASVVVDGVTVSSIKKGLLVLVGFAVNEDRQALAGWAQKLVHLRIFPDALANMNLDVSQVGGEILIVSQFTLYGNCSRGNRPSFVEAMPYEEAQKCCNTFVALVGQLYPKVQTGVFGAHMVVHLINDGPVTLVLGN